MTTGQKTTGGGLREAAEAARLASASATRDRRAEEREQSLTDAIERLSAGVPDSNYASLAYRLGDESATTPAREDFTYATVTKEGHGRYDGDVHGWAFEIDGVRFLQSTEHGNRELLVIVTCPDCGAERAETFHGLDDLGALLRAGRGYGHRCRQVETRAIAYAIGTAARDLRISEYQLVEEALEAHADLIARLRFGR